MDFEQVDNYERLRNLTWVGFAHVYLFRCKNVFKTNDEIDIEVFTKLAQLDAKLGTTASEQLLECLRNTTRSDIIKVINYGGYSIIKQKAFEGVKSRALICINFQL